MTDRKMIKFIAQKLRDNQPPMAMQAVLMALSRRATTMDTTIEINHVAISKAIACVLLSPNRWKGA